MLEMKNVRVCRRCLLAQEADEADAQMIQTYVNYLKPEDMVSDEVYHTRISHCRSCKHRLNNTCQACGCYIEFRANAKNGSCPKKKW